MKQGIGVTSFMALLALFLWFQGRGFAETYQWTDKEGAIHFSDNPIHAPKGKTSVIRQENQPRWNNGIDSIKTEKASKDENGDKKPEVNFIPGQYEVRNWMELPGKGRSKEENDVHCLTKSDIGWKMYGESGCELLSENTHGDTTSWEMRCGFNGVDSMSGSITYSGDSFDGTLLYHSEKDTLKIGLSGKRIGSCSESKW